MYGTPKLPPFSSLCHSNASFGIWGVWSHAYTSNTPKTDMCKKSTPCLIQKASRRVSDHTSKTTMLFIFHFLYNTKILRENHTYLFFISLVQWWKLYYIFIFFTKRTTDFNRIKKKHEWWNNRFSDVFIYRLSLKNSASLFFSIQDNFVF